MHIKVEHCSVYFYLVVRSVKSFVKIGSRLEIALFFLFYQNLYSPGLFPPLTPAYLILPNVSTLRLLGTSSN